MQIKFKKILIQYLEDTLKHPYCFFLQVYSIFTYKMYLRNNVDQFGLSQAGTL